MANAKAIKAKIKSISNIQKITSALEVVSTVKLQKVKEQADNLKHYMTEFLYILDMVDFSRIFKNTDKATSDKKLVVVVWTEKWLCWALNSKLFKKVYDETKNEKEKIDVFVVWKKALEFFTRMWYNIVWVLNLKDTFSEKDLQDLRAFLIKAIDDNKYLDISIFFNYFRNTMVQIPTQLQLFPLLRENFESFAKTIELDVNLTKEYNQDIIIEPSEEEFYSFVMKKFISDMVYATTLQNKAWEHASRMIAMKNAKDNSIELKKWLTISYNKQRQASVTQEISEIVSAKIAMEG